MFGSKTDKVKDILRKKDYEIKNTQIADIRVEEYCVKNDVKVVFALR